MGEVVLFSHMVLEANQIFCISEKYFSVFMSIKNEMDIRKR